VKLVATRLCDYVVAWWDKIQEMGIQKGKANKLLNRREY
jgi:hypothetical protein